jgi:Protein of unknown function (DUF2637)
VTERADRWIRRTTIGCVALLAVIAGTISFMHMHLLVEMRGQPGWVAALTPLSVDGMIVAASTTLLAESRSGGRGGFLPWALLVVGSVTSLAANVAVAEPTVTGTVIAAWPSFALIASYELLMWHVRRAADASVPRQRPGRSGSRLSAVAVVGAPVAGACGQGPEAIEASASGGQVGRDMRVMAWRWALANRAGDGSLPSGKDIGREHDRHERWGRLVKRALAWLAS